MEEYNSNVDRLKLVLDQVDPNSLFPDPIKRTINAILNYRNPAPGEIKISQDGKLLQEYLEYDGLIKPMIQAFDNFLEVLLPRRITSTIVPFSLGVIKFKDVKIRPPTKQIVGAQLMVKQLPLNARQDRTTYAVSIEVTMIFEPNNKSQPVQKQTWRIGEIPVMLGSKFCNLHGLSDQKLISVGECVNDPFGYFIIEGQSKVVLQHEKLRYNKPFIFRDKKKTIEPDTLEEAIAITSKKNPLSSMICRFTAMPSLDSPEYLEELQVTKEVRYDAKKTTIVELHYVIGTSAIVVKLQGFLTDTYLNIFYVYELLGIKNTNTMKNMILNYIPMDQRAEILTLLNRCEMDYHIKENLLAKLKSVMKMPEKVESLPTAEQIKYYQNRFSEVLFKHIEGVWYDTDDEKYHAKLQMLSIMAARYAQYQIKKRHEDQRDSWSNKRIVSAGPAMEHLFNQIWSHMMVETLIKYLSTITVNERAFNISGAVNVLQGNFMRETFVKSFNPNTWGIPGSIIKENMTDFLKDETLVAKYSQLLRISPDTSDKGKQTSIREVNATQLGYVCPIETPEGKQCGIVKNMAVGCYVSIGRDESDIVEYVNEKLMLSSNQTQIYDSAFILNGKFLGWCKGTTAVAELREARRSQRIEKDVLIYYENPRIVWVYCDAGRPTRPLLIVDNNQDKQQLLIDKKNLWNAPFSELLKNGVVEYIDAYEQEFDVKLAESIWDPVFSLVDNYTSAVETSKGQTKKRPVTYQRNPDAYNAYRNIVKQQRFTHCELDPNAILSLASSLIPMPDREQAPRNTYQASMVKQAGTNFGTNAINQFPTSSKGLAYPVRPVFETQMYNYIGMDKQPIGETVQVAIMTYGGWNQEDSIIINQAAVDMGRFRMVRVLTYKTIQLTGNKEFIENIQKPIKKNVPNLDSLDEEGVILQGSYVKQGDCLIGKVKQYRDTKEIVDASVYVGIGDSGIVERVLKTSSSESRKIVLVKIREVRMPRAGDKLASRYAQKGTIGIVLPEESMPFVSTGPNKGQVPDIIINPHSIPSRMTIGKLFEILSSKVATMKGERIDATAFREFDLERYQDDLARFGFNRNGYEIMINGMTGKQIQTPIFMGPCYYQALRHHVQDKIQQRGRGPVKITTRQPTAGRANNGGIRFGEMERDAIVSHGAAYCLKEKTFDHSDAYKTIFCRKCGTIANIKRVNLDTPCPVCGQKQYGSVPLPYSYKVLSQELAAASIFISLELEPEEKALTMKH
jgi:DNA-directed RNA polymerase II subunit RPB2